MTLIFVDRETYTRLNQLLQDKTDTLSSVIWRLLPNPHFVFWSKAASQDQFHWGPK